jgi:hypothetical protein
MTMSLTLARSTVPWGAPRGRDRKWLKSRSAQSAGMSGFSSNSAGTSSVSSAVCIAASVALIPLTKRE